MTGNVSREKVAFIAHPIDAGIFRSYFSSLRPDKKYDGRLQLKLFEWATTYSVKQFPALSLDGMHSVDAELFMVPFLPEMQAISVKKVIGKIDDALALAKAHRCTIAAMGGFTSIALQNLELDLSRKHDIRITSGNTFTAALIIRSVEDIAGRFGVDLSSTTLAIIGASGDIGSGCVDYFCRRVKKLILTARSVPALRGTFERFRPVAAAEMEITDDNREAIGQSAICIFVTSAFVPLFTEKDFVSGTIVCDASAPPNVVVDEKLREDVFIYHGGIAEIPFPIDIEFDIGLASPYMFYGCQLEGLLLGLHPEYPCSWGRGNITLENLNRHFDLFNRYHTLRQVFTIGKRVYTDAQLVAYGDKWNRFRPRTGQT